MAAGPCSTTSSSRLALRAKTSVTRFPAVGRLGQPRLAPRLGYARLTPGARSYSTRLNSAQNASYDALGSYEDVWAPNVRLYKPEARTKERPKLVEETVQREVPQNPPADQAAPQQMAYSKDFLLQRLVVFSAIFIGYSAYYITRNSLTYAAPLMLADPALNMNLTQIGALTSLFPIAYGTSKFVSGVLSARFSPSFLLAMGLMATALVNVAFGFSSSLLWFSLLWFANGVLQGVGGPTCATIVTNWYSQKERGTWWALWSAAHNFGGFIAPLIIGWAASNFGWRWGMFAPGLLGLAVGCFVLVTAKDKPLDAGFLFNSDAKPTSAGDSQSSSAQQATMAESRTEAVSTSTDKQGKGVFLVNRGNSLQVSTRHDTQSSAAEASPSKAAPTPAKPAVPEKGMKEYLVMVLKNPYVWLLALTYFFIYVVRQGVLSWFVFYMVAEKGVMDSATAAVTMSGVELGGLVGGTLAGVLSDWYIKLVPGTGGTVGKRVQIVVLYTIATIASLVFFRSCPTEMGWLAVFMVGFAIYGPQMLIGLCGAELVAPAAVGASQGLLGWIAYLGAANAGIPLSWLVQTHGWDAYFNALIAACGAALLLLLPMLGARSFVERQKAAEQTMRPAFA